MSGTRPSPPTWCRVPPLIIAFFQTNPAGDFRACYGYNIGTIIGATCYLLAIYFSQRLLREHLRGPAMLWDASASSGYQTSREAFNRS
jgi:hypothetical protein